MNFIINRKTLISMLFIGISLLGIFSYKQLSMELYPSTEMPMLFVSVSSNTEVDPNYLEKTSVIPTEGAISTMEGIDEINTTINSRSARIVVKYNKDIDIKYAYLKLEQKLASIKSTLPEGVSLNLFKAGFDLNSQFMTLQVIGSGGVDRVRSITEKELKSKFVNIDGIANVDIFGGREKSLDIVIDEDRCEALNISINKIVSLITNGQKTRTYVGTVLNKENKKAFVNVISEYNDINELENIVVDKKSSLLLKDIATITFGVKEQESFSRINGKDAVSLNLSKSSQVNLIDLSNRTKEVINKINKEFKSNDIEVKIHENVADTMEKNIDQIINLALTGGILAVIILWFFLRNIGIVTVISVAIPTSVFAAFNFFYAYDISINSLTLVGIALAIGMLLDNSIVVMENIYRLYSKGHSADKAVTQGTKEVWRSILAATMTTITVFLPFIFSSNVMLKLIGKHVGVSIISTLLLSLVVALLLVPMATHFFLKRNTKKNFINLQAIPFHNRLMQVYIVLLKMSLRNPAKTIIGAIVIFFVTILSCMALNNDSTKQAEVKQINLYVTMPEGSTLESTDTFVKNVEKQLNEVKDKGDIISNIYTKEAQITFKIRDDFKSSSIRSISTIRDEVDDIVNENSQYAEISTEASEANDKFRGSSMEGSNDMLSMFNMGSGAEKVIIKGRDSEKMMKLAEDLKYYIEDIENISFARINIHTGNPEVKLYFDEFAMTENNINPSLVAQELNSFKNHISTSAKFKNNKYEYAIIIKDKKTALLDKQKLKRKRTLDDLKAVNIKNPEGVEVPLTSFTDIIKSTSKSQIKRKNQEKEIIVKYYMDRKIQDDKTMLENTRKKIDDVVAKMKLPAGIAVEVVHKDNKTSEYSFLILAALVIIFMILASIFESISTPFVLMFSIPLAAIGSFLGLFFSGHSLFNTNTIIGFVILLGVVVNNGIILIDYTNILRKRGYNKNRSLIMAGMARVRPILITAITSIVAMMPLALGDEEYVSTIGAPFAITVIGGLSVSTILTLIFIPTLFNAIDSALNWIKELSISTKITQLVIAISFIVLTFIFQESLWMRILFLFLITTLIPTITWFILSSLRKVDTNIIDKDEEITIEIRNLTKIYDRPSTFQREWNAGQKIRERLSLNNKYESLKDLSDLSWQIPLLAFLVYFNYLYLNSKFYIFVFSFLTWKLSLLCFKAITKYLENTERRKLFKISSFLTKLIYWGTPLFLCIYMAVVSKALGSGIFSATLFYLVMIIDRASTKVLKENIRIDNISGRFGGFKRLFYRFVKSVPLIGKKHKPFRANHALNIKIETGMFGLLGPNGAGKTTLMRNICGIFEQTYGKILINGIDTQKKREELQGLIGYLPQEFGTYENLTPSEYLDYQAILKGISNPETRQVRIQQVLESVHMLENKDKKIGGFSGGMKQRIGIAQTLLHLPRILVVDEPTAGLDPRERIRFRNLLVELSKKRIVIFSTHIIEDIASSCNQVAVINRGELKYSGNPNDMSEIAKGHVWQFDIDPSELEEIMDKYIILHHMKVDDKIRVRCLNEDSPRENAISVNPILEDSYLWLLK